MEASDLSIYLLFVLWYYRWGRRPVLHVMNFLFLASRVLILAFHNNYPVLLVVTAIGSSFYPVGVRVAYIVGKLHDAS